MIKREIKVWDMFIRLFHWALVAAFVIAFATENHSMLIHSLAGYLITILVVARLTYGFIGTRYARFANILYKPTTAIIYVKNVLMFKAPRYIGHNPAGGLIVILMLLSLLVTCFSGMITLALDQHTGPLAEHLMFFPGWLIILMDELHEVVAYLTLMLVATHVAGVLIESIVHQENLTRSMINGRKRN